MAKLLAEVLKLLLCSLTGESQSRSSLPPTDQCSLRPRAGGAQGKGGASGLQWHVPRAANVSRGVGAGVWGRSGWGPPRGKSNVGRWEVKLFGLVQLCSFKSHPPAPGPLSLPRPAQPELPTVGPSHCVIGQPSSPAFHRGEICCPPTSGAF